MSKRYEPQNIEKKWQKIWQDEKAFAATDDYTKPKYYALVEFPYPSGQGLHVGHPRPYTALDIVARKRRMQGYNVLYPMGWDAFGLPTENYAIKNHIHPKIVTKSNVHHFKDQLQSLGYSFDWDREINTTDPEYYHWTQWIFLKLFNAVQTVDQLVCILGDLQHPLALYFADNRTSAALAHAVYNFLVCKTYLTGSTPVDRHFFLVSKTCFEEFEEDHRVCRQADRRSGRR